MLAHFDEVDDLVRIVLPFRVFTVDAQGHHLDLAALELLGQKGQLFKKDVFAFAVCSPVKTFGNMFFRFDARGIKVTRPAPGTTIQGVSMRTNDVNSDNTSNALPELRISN